jgi:hypothetical protein
LGIEVLVIEERYWCIVSFRGLINGFDDGLREFGFFVNDDRWRILGFFVGSVVVVDGWGV